MKTLKYKGYTGTVEFDPDDKTFYGRVIDLKDVITFESQDATKLEEEFQISVDAYLEFCEDLGDEPEKPYSGKFNVRISPELHRLASIKAIEENISLNTFVAYAMETAVKKESKQYVETFAGYDTTWIDETPKIQSERISPCGAPANVSLGDLFPRNTLTRYPIAPRGPEKEFDDAAA